MNTSNSKRQRRAKVRTIAVMAVIAVPVVVGLVLLGLSGPQTNSVAQTTPTSPTPSPSTPSATGSPSAPALARSAPVRLAIPAIGVDGGLQDLSLDANKKTIQLPKDPRLAGWYSQSASPGQTGLTIILGYIKSNKGPGVFQKLSALKSASEISLRRTDGTDVVYKVDKIASYTPKNFPAAQVYAQTKQPALRIITCGGALRPGLKPGNVVVFAHQVAVRTAG